MLCAVCCPKSWAPAPFSHYIVEGIRIGDRFRDGGSSPFRSLGIGVGSGWWMLLGFSGSLGLGGMDIRRSLISVEMSSSPVDCQLMRAAKLLGGLVQYLRQGA